MRLNELLAAAKALCRTGWMIRGVPGGEAESVAEHSFEAAVLAYMLAQRLLREGAKVSPERAATMAIFHDMGETVMGDLVKWTGKRVDKEKVEKEAYKQVEVGEELFQEYLQRDSIEAKVSKLADVLSTHLQAIRYSRLGYKMDDIVNSTDKELEGILSDRDLAVLRGVVLDLKGGEDS